MGFQQVLLLKYVSIPHDLSSLLRKKLQGLFEKK